MTRLEMESMIWYYNMMLIKKIAKTSSLSSGKIDKYEYLTGEERLPSSQRQILEETKFSYSPLGKAFRKQIKSIKEQKERQIKAIQNRA